MSLFTPFSIPKKENCDLCRFKHNKEKAVKKNLLANFFLKLYWQKFDYVFD